MRQPMPWLALPLAVLLSWAIRHGVTKPGAFAAVLCALATALAAVYVSMLIAAAQIAGSMGLGLVETLRTAGTGMLWELARLGVSRPDVAWAIVAIVIAAWLGIRPLPLRKTT
jgi:vitamin B12 transport system permease protein